MNANITRRVDNYGAEALAVPLREETSTFSGALRNMGLTLKVLILTYQQLEQLWNN
jgi:hypothetical protein